MVARSVDENRAVRVAKQRAIPVVAKGAAALSTTETDTKK